MFWTRTASGAVLLVIAALLFWFGGLPLAICLTLISMVGYRELLKALNKDQNKKVDCLEILGYVSILSYYLVLILTKNPTIWLMILVFAIMASLFAYVLAFPKFHVDAVMGSIFSFFYAPVMLSFLYLVRELDYGKVLVWLVLICSWGSDTLAYVCGRLFGKRKAFPKLSPKKTVAGVVGGILGAAGLGAIYAYFTIFPDTNDIRIVAAIACISGVSGIMSIVGDLAASAIKRNVELKDYGKLIPGHGGIMDRFDSVIVTAPIIYFLSVLVFPLILK